MMRLGILRMVIRELLESSSRKFALGGFDKIGSLGDMNRYALDHDLHMLGCGSSRCAYRLSSKKVLKVARNEKGVAQNHTEVEVYTDPKTKPIVTQIYQAGTGYKWIVSELVRPITNSKEFKQLTGVEVDDFKQFLAIMKGQLRGRPSRMGPDTQQEAAGQETPNAIISKYKGPSRDFLEAVASLMQSADLLGGDLKYVDHWGKTSDGRVVLLDYGFTGEVWSQHYKPPPGEVSNEPKGAPSKRVSPPDAETGTAGTPHSSWRHR